jgi:hypothetical protein
MATRVELTISVTVAVREGERETGKRERKRDILFCKHGHCLATVHL